MTEDLDDLAERYAEFVEKRDWTRFYTTQNLCMAISVEANELLELFLWYNNPPAERVLENEELAESIREELADVVIYSIALANRLDMDLLTLVAEKMDENSNRFDEETTAEITERLDRWQ